MLSILRAQMPALLLQYPCPGLPHFLLRSFADRYLLSNSALTDHGGVSVSDVVGVAVGTGLGVAVGNGVAVGTGLGIAVGIGTVVGVGLGVGFLIASYSSRDPTRIWTGSVTLIFVPAGGYCAIT